MVLVIWSTIKTTINDNWPVITIFLVTMISMRFFYYRSHREKMSLYREFFSILAIIYIFLLFQLLTKVELNHGSGYNIVPFTEILRYEFGSRLFYYNVIGNIVIFLPFGYFVADYIKSKNIFPAMLISALVSFTVEFVQLNIGRSFDVDDIILNVLGGIIGYLIYIAIQAIKNHLPSFFRKDGLYNFICLVIIIIIILYILSSLGVVRFS